MTTHQEDFHRMCLTGWLVGRFGIRSWVECGVLEGETAGYFSQLIVGARGYGCDLDEAPVKIGRARYPELKLDVCHSTAWLQQVELPSPVLFYLDSMWKPEWPGLKEVEIIQHRWPGSVIFLNGLKVNDYFIGRYPVEPLQKYGRVIVPIYSHSIQVAGYGVIVPDSVELPPLKHWKVLPKT